MPDGLLFNDGDCGVMRQKIPEINLNATSSIWEAHNIFIPNTKLVQQHENVKLLPQHNNYRLENSSSFYKRLLPRSCIAFSSSEGRQIFQEALLHPLRYMVIYFPLAEQFTTQSEPAYCGLSTLVMCLNALQLDPGREWRRPWRWFSEELFGPLTKLDEAKEKGIDFLEFTNLARSCGASPVAYQADGSLDVHMFRALVKKCCSSEDQIMVLNYSRKVLGQTGDGHFSPIGGYHPDKDLVLMMDVARFKYPPHWIPLQLAFESIQEVDSSSGKSRGVVILQGDKSISDLHLSNNLP